MLIRLSYEGSITIEGKSPKRDGFIGGMVRLATGCDPGLWIKDNHSLVMTDFYTEQSQHFIRLEGGPGMPAGRVTMQGAKFELAKPENNAVEVNNYEGELFLGPYNYYIGNPIHRFVQTGEAPFELTVWAGSFYDSKPEFTMGPSAKVALLGTASPGEGIEPVFPDIGAERAPKLVRALDDLRRVGVVEAAMVAAEAK